MKNFRKIGSSFLDRLCGIWSPIPLEVRSCALRQSISTPPWQQQCSPNDCTMGSKLFYCVKTILLCQNYFTVSKLLYCVKTILFCQTMDILKELQTTTCSLLWKTKPILTQKEYILKPNLTDNQLFWVDATMYGHLNLEFALPMKI